MATITEDTGGEVLPRLDASPEDWQELGRLLSVRGHILVSTNREPVALMVPEGSGFATLSKVHALPVIIGPQWGLIYGTGHVDAG